MRELRQDWRDIFNGFRVALCFGKLLNAFLGIALTIAFFWLVYALNEANFVWYIIVMSAFVGGLLLAMLAKVVRSGSGMMIFKALFLAILAVVLVALIICAGFKASTYYTLRREVAKDEALHPGRLELAVSGPMSAERVGIEAKKDSFFEPYVRAEAPFDLANYVKISNRDLAEHEHLLDNYYGALGVRTVVMTVELFIVGLLIWAMFGGAITRIAVVEVATDDRIGWKESVKFSCCKYKSYVASVAGPIIGILFFMVCLGILGVIWSVNWVDFATAILFALVLPLVLLAGVFVAIIVIAYVPGLPLLFPAISAEGSDGFDAISRTFSYVYTKPWSYIFYTIAGVIYWAICTFFIKIFACISLGSAREGVMWGAYFTGKDGPREHFAGIFDATLGSAAWLLNGVHSLGERVVYLVSQVDFTGNLSGSGKGVITQFFELTLVVPKVNAEWFGRSSEVATGVVLGIVLCIFIGFLLAYVVSLSFTIDSIVYLLMRKKVDGTDMTEVYLEEEEEDYLEAAVETETEAAEEEKAEEKPEGKKEKGGETKPKSKKKSDKEDKGS